MLFVGGPEKADDFIVLLICVSHQGTDRKA